jgi:hypothetical protein
MGRCRRPCDRGRFRGGGRPGEGQGRARDIEGVVPSRWQVRRHTQAGEHLRHAGTETPLAGRDPPHPVRRLGVLVRTILEEPLVEVQL